MIDGTTQWRYRNLVTALLLVVAAWIIYLPSVHYGFVYFDDVRILRDHPELYGQPRFGTDLKAIFVTGFPREEPLLARDVSWAIDSRVFGFGNPLGYHLGNILLHGIVVALMFVFLLGTTGRFGFALATATAWLLLAVHTEPVAWIMGLKDIMSALFMLLALCAQTRRLTARGPAAQCGWYALTLVFFVIALLSKINVLTFPLVLFLHGIFFPYLRGERKPDEALPWGREFGREAALLAPALAASGIVYVWYQRTLAQMGLFDRGYTAHGLAHLWNLLVINPMGLWIYFRQVFFPWHLSVLYTWPGLEVHYPIWQIAIALATVTASIGVGIWLLCRHKDIFFYYAAFFVLMVPYLNLIYIGIWIADRYIYFSAFCILAIAVLIAERAFRGARPMPRIAALSACIAFGAVNVYQTFAYQPMWRNAETLWRYHLALPQPSSVAYENLAAWYYADFSSAHAQHDLPGMVSCLQNMEAVIGAGLAQYWPNHDNPPPVATSYLFFLKSLAQEVKGDENGALASLLMSDHLRPGFAPTNLNLSLLYQKLAASAQSPQQRRTYLEDAKGRLSRYIALTWRGRPAPPDVQKQLTDIEAECASLSGNR
ncbi:MAG TPA: hypothetical protein VMF08_00905 [Candidatus Sulfotelmatobacter sp.]|nr:hypothetical protein [Candidatus Sulfotelmatobacter sp.]